MAGLHEGGTVGSMLITAIVRYAERPAIADERAYFTDQRDGFVEPQFCTRQWRTVGIHFAPCMMDVMDPVDIGPVAIATVHHHTR